MKKCSPSVSPRNQPTSSTCWYSCLQMLFEWKKRDRSTIISTMDSSPNLFPYYMLENGIAPSECKETAKILGLSWAGDGEIDAEVLANALVTYGPYWVAGMWKKGSSHVIVVTGCDPEQGQIRYVDPWMNHDLSETWATVSWLNARGKIWKETNGSLMYWA